MNRSNRATLSSHDRTGSYPGSLLIRLVFFSRRLNRCRNREQTVDIFGCHKPQCIKSAPGMRRCHTAWISSPRSLELRQVSCMIMRGFVINAQRAGKALAKVTTTANASGAASHTHKVGEPLPGVILLIHRDNAKDMSIPASIPAQASRVPSLST